MLTAVSLAEGAGLGDGYWDIVFVYIILIQAFGFEMGMRRSSTYPHYGEITASDREKENYDQNKLESIGSFKGWMMALGAGEKYRTAQIFLVGNVAVMVDPTTKTQYKLIKTREHEVPK